MSLPDLPPAADYAAAWPFPHAVIDGAWGAAFCQRVANEMPPPSDPRWRRFANDRENKLEGSDASMWGPYTHALAAVLRADDWRARLSAMTGIPDLICSFVGGGYHRIEPGGGRLDVHTDFNQLDGLWRRLNCLVYLNDAWPGDVGGELELWPLRDGVPTPMDSVDIQPVLDRTVVFTTSDRSWHGHPTPLARSAPPRLSFAAYYFTEARPDDASDPHDTVFVER